MIAWLSRDLRAPLTGAVAILAAWPLVFSGAYDLRLFTLAGVYVLLVIGYQFIFGYAGALALTQGAFFGVGAYMTGILGVRYGWAFAETFPLSIAAPVALAVIVAVPVLRLDSHYFALATLGIAQVLLLVCREWIPVTGGANGLSGVPGIVLGGVELARGWPTLAFVWSVVAVGAALAGWIVRDLRGVRFHLVRVAPAAAGAIGIDGARCRLAAFLLSAAYAGAAGALFVHVNRIVSPDVLEFPLMVTCLAMTVIGGATRLSGAFAGALLLVYLPEWFRPLDKYYLIAYGAGLLAMIVAAPNGLIGAAARLRQQFVPETPRPSPLPEALPHRPQPGGSLVIRGVSKSFGGVKALQNVSFEVRAGEILGLIGPNGSGKTTLVNIASGLERGDRGEVRLGGQDLMALAPAAIARRGVARTFQTPNLADALSILDNVAAARSGVDGGTARRQAMGLLEMLGLSALAMRPAGSVSHAMKRQAEIARALALEPQVLLLDEPAAGLTEAEQAALGDRLQKLKTAGLTLLVIEHNLPFLIGLADRLVCLDGGQVMAEGRPDEVRENPRVIEAYLGRSAAPEARP
jgi:branched-chain amino acid transport system permease protein